MQIVGYDLRGGTGAALALGSQGQHPSVLEVALRQALLQLPELDQQTSVARSAVQSINLDPVDSNRLAFHLASGWSGQRLLTTSGQATILCCSACSMAESGTSTSLAVILTTQRSGQGHMEVLCSL